MRKICYGLGEDRQSGLGKEIDEKTYGLHDLTQKEREIVKGA